MTETLIQTLDLAFHTPQILITTEKPLLLLESPEIRARRIYQEMARADRDVFRRDYDHAYEDACMIQLRKAA
jgi:hypothetical protein